MNLQESNYKTVQITHAYDHNATSHIYTVIHTIALNLQRQLEIDG